MNRRILALGITLVLLGGLLIPLAPQATAPKHAHAAAGNWCVAGTFNGWDNAGHPLYDDGTHGDLIPDDSVFTLDHTLASADRHEWKVVECGNWDTAYPASENAWLHTSTAGQTVKFTFDANDHGGDAGWALLPSQNTVNVWGDDLPAGFTAVGDFQGWNNSDPGTEMSDLGNGIFWLTYTIPTAGSHIGKITATGTWDAFGADGRSQNATNVSFATTSADEEVVFLLDSRAGRVLIEPQGSGTGSWCVAGDFNGWDNTGDPLYDDGTHGDLLGGDGIFTVDYEIAAADRYEWKIVECGNWSNAYPANNAWLNTDTADQTVKLTFDTNDHSADAGTKLYPTQNIVNAWDALPPSFTAVGDFQGWNNSDPATELDDVGYGIHHLNEAVTPAGDYIGKITATGSWDAVSTDGRNINAPNFDFTVHQDGDNVDFVFDAYSGRMTILPAPPPPQASHDHNVWWDGLYHDSRDPLYRTPGGAVITGTTVTLRLRAYANDLTAAQVRVWDDRLNAQTLLDMEVAASDGDYDWWEADVPVGSDPTIHWYRFVAVDGTDTDYYEDDADRTMGVGQPFDESQDNSWQITVYNPAFQSPDWVKNAVIYQIFPERFYDGDPGNNPPAGSFHYNLPDGSIVRSTGTDWHTPLCDPRDTGGDCPGKYGENFYGGDLQGIIDKLDYLEDLGVTALYLNPIFESPSNHKYDTTDFGVIDDNFGDLSTFITLTAEAENRGMHVILDGVFNHTSSDSIYFDRYSRFDADGNLTSPDGPGANDGSGACESPDSPYRDWYYFEDVTPGTGDCVGSDGTPDAAAYESWFGYDSLPKLKADNPEVRAMVWSGGTDSIAPYWISKGGGGWRLDVAGDVDPGVTNDPTNDYWEGFRSAVRDVDGGTYIVGEEWGNSTPWLIAPEWDASMNYQFGTAIMGFWRDTPFTDNDHNTSSSAGVIEPLAPSQLDERLHYLEERYPPEAFYAMMNLLGSHDTNRALFLLDHNAAVTTDDTLLDDPTYDWSDAVTRLKGVWLLQMTLPGAPTTYYGDEVGLVGPTTYAGGKWEDDPYNRLPYPWLNESGTPFYTHLQSQASQDALRSYYRRLTDARNSHPALRTGSFDALLTDDGSGVYAYGRRTTDSSDAAVIIANTGTTQTVTVGVGGYLGVGTVLTDVLDGGASYTVGSAGEIVVPDVPAMSGAVLVLESGVGTPPDAVDDLSVTNEGSRELTLAWSAAAGADSYTLYRSPVSGGGYTAVATTTNTAYTDTGLINAATYYYVVISRDDTTRLESGYSNEVAGMPHDTIGWANLQWPSEITHTIGITPTEDIYGQVWIDGVTSESGATPGLMAQVGFGPTTRQPISWTHWVDAAFNTDAGNNDEFKGQLVPEETGEFHYVYRYSTTNGETWTYADASGPIDGAAVVSPGLLHVQPAADTAPPAVPQNLRVTDWSVGSISLAWDPVADGDLYAYDLFRYGEGETSGDAVEVGRVLPPAAAYTDTAVTTGQTYTYTVRALDRNFNASPASNEASAAADARLVELRFHVTVPDFTPIGDTLYIAGSDEDAFGAVWDAGGQALTQLSATEYAYVGKVADGTALQYKYTRGTWETVENWGTLVGLANREMTADYGATGVMTLTDTVHNWRDPIVMDHYPLADAATWDITRPLSVTLNRQIDTTRVNTTTFLLEGSRYGHVDGTFGFEPTMEAHEDPIYGTINITGTQILYTPAISLDPIQKHTVTLLAAGFYDDTEMRSDYLWSFGIMDHHYIFPIVFKNGKP